MLGKDDRTASCEGVIAHVARYDCESYWLTVRYCVGGMEYELKEMLAMKSEAIKIGPIPVGRRVVPVLPRSEVGDTVVVCYNPSNPSSAHLRDNAGFFERKKKR